MCSPVKASPLALTGLLDHHLRLTAAVRQLQKRSAIWPGDA